MAEKNPKVCILTSIYFTSLASAKTRQVLKDDSTLFCFTIQFKCSGFYVPSISDILG